MQPNRIEPAAPVTAYRTFAVTAPLATHFRRATCEEAGCAAFTNGWVTRVQNPEQADYIRRNSGRTFDEREPGVFVFAAGQVCFGASDHRVRIERGEHYLVRDGDWRGNPTGNVRRHTSSSLWVEEFAEHQDFLKTIKERG
jgi:hypothetical protein